MIILAMICSDLTVITCHLSCGISLYLSYDSLKYVRSQLVSKTMNPNAHHTLHMPFETPHHDAYNNHRDIDEQ